MTKDMRREQEAQPERTIAAKGLGDKSLDVGSPLDDEPLQEETLDDVAATAGWLGDNTEKGVADLVANVVWRHVFQSPPKDMS